MPYGFYITDKGRELITASTKNESKVEITKACFGSGGNSETERNYAITSLVNQFYEKDFQPGIDSYIISETDPTELCIETVLPSEVSGTINEIGYKDSSDNLIIYGVVREKVKEAGTEAEGYQLRYENWVRIANSDIDKIEINVEVPEVKELSGEIQSVKSTVTKLDDTVTSVESNVTSISGTVSQLESSYESLESTISELGDTYVEQTTYKTFVENVRQLIPSGTQISDGSKDLNTTEFLTKGNYYCPMASTAQSLSNCPTTHGFMMEVLLPLNAESYVVRIITDSVGDQYFQNANNKNGSYTYSTWEKYVRASEIEEYETRISALETTLNGLADTLERLI